MNALAEVTAASPVIAEYYQGLLVVLPLPMKDELVSLAYLLIGTCGASGRKAAFLCADRAAKVFGPQHLRNRGRDGAAERMLSCEPVVDEISASRAWCIGRDSRDLVGGFFNAATALLRLTHPIDAPDLTSAADYTAQAAGDVKDWAGGIQLFKDLCDLPRG